MLGMTAMLTLYILTSKVDNLPRFSSPIRRGEIAPDFNLLSLNEHPFNLEAMRGKPVLINFWAAWCDPCRNEMPLLESTYTQHSEDLILIGINQGDKKAEVKNFAEKETISFPLLLDEKMKVGDLYQISGYPTSIFIDQNGIIQAIYLGELNADQLKQNLQRIGID